MSSSTTRIYAEESTGSINVENVKSNRLALPKLLFTSPGALPKGKYHFAHCGGEESRLSIGRGIGTNFHMVKDKYSELLTWKEKQPLPINVAASTAIGALQGAFAGILLHTAFQAYVGSQAVRMAVGSGAGLTLALLLGKPPNGVLATGLRFAASHGIAFKLLEAYIGRTTTTTD